MKKLIAGGLTGVLGALMFASSAFGASHNPTGEFAQFNECPLNRASITDCIYSVTSGGSFTIGNKTVPLVNPVTLQGGFEGEEEGIEFYGAENGNTLSKTPQPVPGGLLGIVAPTWWPKFIQNWFNNLINEGFTGVNATVELTGPTKGLTNVKLNTENLLFEEGTALGLPVKFHLENAILGSGCYIGSETKPGADRLHHRHQRRLTATPATSRSTTPSRSPRSAAANSSTTPTRRRASTVAGGSSPSSSTRWSTRSSAPRRHRAKTPPSWKANSKTREPKR